MLRIHHVDEIDDDDAAEIAKAQLPRNRLRRLQVGSENGLLEAAGPQIPAGVHIDGNHGFGLLDDQMPPGLQRHLPRQRSVELFLQPESLEQRISLLV